MIIDDYKVEEINDLIAKSINAIKERHTQGQSIIRFMGAQAPIFGMMGTLIGLIQMMENLSDPSAIGPGLAVALNTTFYGILLSNLVFNPLAVKLSTRTDSETHLIKVIHAGIYLFCYLFCIFLRYHICSTLLFYPLFCNKQIRWSKGTTTCLNICGAKNKKNSF